MELKSTLISNPKIVDTSKKVLIFAEKIAKEYDLLASDLILAAVWHCLSQAGKTNTKADSKNSCETENSDKTFVSKKINSQQHLVTKQCKSSFVEDVAGCSTDGVRPKIESNTNKDDVNIKVTTESSMTNSQSIQQNNQSTNIKTSESNQTTSRSVNRQMIETELGNTVLDNRITSACKQSSHSNAKEKKDQVSVTEGKNDEIISIDDEDLSEVKARGSAKNYARTETVVSAEENEPYIFEMDCDEIDDTYEYENFDTLSDEAITEGTATRQMKDTGIGVSDEKDLDVTVISDDENDCDVKDTDNSETTRKQTRSQTLRSQTLQEGTSSRRKQAHTDIKVEVPTSPVVEGMIGCEKQSSSEQVDDQENIPLVHKSPGPLDQSVDMHCGTPPRKKRLLDYDKKWHEEPKYSLEQDKYLALPGGIDGNSISTNWRQPGKYTSISKFSHSQGAGTEETERDEQVSNVDDNDNNDYYDDEVSNDNHGDKSDGSDDDWRKKLGIKSVTRGRGRPRIHDFKTRTGSGLKRDQRHTSNRGANGSSLRRERPRGQSPLKGAMGKRGLRRRCASQNLSTKTASLRDLSPSKFCSWKKGSFSTLRGNKNQFSSLRRGKPNKFKIGRGAKWPFHGESRNRCGKPVKLNEQTDHVGTTPSYSSDGPGTSSSGNQTSKRGRPSSRVVQGRCTKGRASSKPPESTICIVKKEEIDDVIVID